jgi:hypothetical protein
MSRYYADDNYGTYEIGPDDDPEEIAHFYRETQRASVRKRCEGCGRMVRIKPEYGYCNACATKREQGYDF